ncbi:hypothetical protein Tco_0327407 [Tanacetum coccineum]
MWKATTADKIGHFAREVEQRKITEYVMEWNPGNKDGAELERNKSLKHWNIPRRTLKNKGIIDKSDVTRHNSYAAVSSKQTGTTKSSSTNIFSTVSTTAKASSTNLVNTVSIPQRRNNHKDFHHCLFACFLSQNEPKKISEAIEDESWVDAMQEELTQARGRNRPMMKFFAVPVAIALIHKDLFSICSHKLFPDSKYPEKDYKVVKAPVRSMIGSLMYVTASRSDIMFAVCACSRSSFDLENLLNSDYAGANLDRKSTTGGCQFLGRRLITWQCKKQTIMATSTTEAEYVAAASCCGQVLWIQNQIHVEDKAIAIRHQLHTICLEINSVQVLKIHTDDNVPYEQQPDPSPRPSPRPSPQPSTTPIVPDSIPEPTGFNQPRELNSEANITKLQEASQNLSSNIKKAYLKSSLIAAKIPKEELLKIIGCTKSLSPNKEEERPKWRILIQRNPLFMKIPSRQDQRPSEIEPPTRETIKKSDMDLLKACGELKILIESKDEVKEEDKGEENTRKRKHGIRKKIKSRKRRFKQDTSQDDPSDNKIPEGFDKVLWGDLIVMFNPDEQDEFWNSQHEWKVVSWKLHSSSGVHTLMTDEGLVVHMLIEKKYPLKKEILMQMLKLKLESEEESTMALELIRFIKKSWLVQDQTVLGKDYSNLLIADSLLKTIWFINAPCYDNEALASPNTNDEELSIPEQTATGKGTSNPLMAGSLPKTTKPT